MRLTYLLVITMLMLSVAAGAATVNLTLPDLAANGWKATATNVYGGSPNVSVTQTQDYGAGNFRFCTGPMPVAWQFQWAGVSTDAFAGVLLSSITSVKIRNYGAWGDSPTAWQPPTFTWIVDKGDSNQRCIDWKPWSGNNARQPGVWNEYDAAVTGQWYVQETGVSYNSLAALKASMPNAYFELQSELPAAWGYASQQAFNVGSCPLYDGDRVWFGGVTGYVDWFEVGVNGEVTRYDLGAPVPEPASLIGLATGLIGLAGLLKRR